MSLNRKITGNYRTQLLQVTIECRSGILEYLSSDTSLKKWLTICLSRNTLIARQNVQPSRKQILGAEIRLHGDRRRKLEFLAERNLMRSAFPIFLSQSFRFAAL
jgi:hypothetical protein